MSIVGVDLSLASTGLCVVNGFAVETFRIISKGGKADSVADRARRVIDITRRIMEHIPQDVALVVVEAPSLGQARQAGEHLRSGLWWHLAAALYLQGHPVVEVPPASLKKYVTNHGNAPKDQVLVAALRRYPQVDISGNDIADAVVLAAIGARHLGQPIETSMPVANLAALDKIIWPQGVGG